MVSQKEVFVNLRFDETLGKIKTSNLGGDRQALERSIDRIERDDIPMVASPNKLHFTSDLRYAFAEARPNEMGPLIVLDGTKLASQSLHHIQADLIRTLAVLDQYPVNGWERRTRLAYMDALAVQRRWLDGNNVGRVPLDPRENHSDSITRTIIGDSRFYADIGYADYLYYWNDMAASDLYSPEELEVMKISSPREFLGLRYQFYEQVYKTGKGKLGNKFTKVLTPDERANVFAVAIAVAKIGISRQ